MFRTAVLPLSFLAAVFAQAATAQVYQGGYNLGPDYGAMIQQVLQQQAQASAQMQQRTQAMVEQVMQDPRCQAMYQQHRVEGGALSFPDFAYQYLATAGFSGPGIARYQQVEMDNQRREFAAHAGVRQAEQNLADAIADGNERRNENQREFREVLGGNRTWVTQDGTRISLPYGGDAVPYTDQNGYLYQRDANGQYYMRDLSGTWYPMAPAR